MITNTFVYSSYTDNIRVQGIVPIIQKQVPDLIKTVLNRPDYMKLMRKVLNLQINAQIAKTANKTHIHIVIHSFIPSYTPSTPATSMIELDVQEILMDESKGQYTFDTYLNRTLKFGPAQAILSTPLYLMLFSEGSESIVLGLLLPVLSQQWSITAFQKSLLITFVYLGVSFGSALQSIADRYGRYQIISLAGALQVIAGVLSAFAPNYNLFLMIRFVYGVGIGIVLPLSATYLSEITPNEYRAMLLSKSRVYWSTGAMLTCALAYFLLSNNHWRILLLLICIPGVLATYLHLSRGQESPRFLLLHKNFVQAKEVIDSMAEMNSSPKLTNQQLQKLQQWVQKLKNKQQIQNPETPVTDEFYSQHNMLLTGKLIVGWVTVCFIYYGIMLLLPLILAQSQMTYSPYFVIFVVSIFELVSFMVASKIMDHPALGRSKTLILSFLICGVASLVLILLDSQIGFLSICMFILIKFMITLAFMTLYPYTAQLYSTSIRCKAMGLTSLVGRIATVILGLVGVYAIKWLNGNGLYLVFVMISSLASWSVHSIGRQTLGSDLDAHLLQMH